MTSLEFNKIVEERTKKIKEILSVKGKEYASEMDLLHNFKCGSQLENYEKTPAEVCWGFMLKHLVLIRDLIESNRRGNLSDVNLIDEKIGDAINYLILLEAILKEYA